MRQAHAAAAAAAAAAVETPPEPRRTRACAAGCQCLRAAPPASQWERMARPEAASAPNMHKNISLSVEGCQGHAGRGGWLLGLLRGWARNTEPSAQGLAAALPPHSAAASYLLQLGGPAGERLGVEAAHARSLQHRATVGAACNVCMPVSTLPQPPALPHMRIAPASSTMMACGQAGAHLGLQEQGPVVGQQEGCRRVAHFLLHLQRQAVCRIRWPAMRGLIVRPVSSSAHPRARLARPAR